MSRRVGAVVQLLLAMALVAGPPLVLRSVVGWPLPRGPVDDVDGIVDAVATGAIPGTFWVASMAVVAWLTWAVLLALLAVELVAVVRNRPSSRWVPLVVRALAQRIVAASLLLSTTATQGVAMVAAPVPFVVATADGDVVAVPAPVADEGPEVRVREDDSWAGWADHVLGDAALGQRVREANVGRDVGGRVLDGSEPWVQAGWLLALPDGLDVAAAQEPAATEAAAAPAVEPDLESEPLGSVEVDPGDSLWRIAEELLGDGRDWTVLWEDNAGRTMSDGRHFTDPDLIHPGWSITIPPVADGPTDDPAESTGTASEDADPPPGPAEQLAATDGGGRWSPSAPSTSAGIEGTASAEPGRRSAETVAPSRPTGHDSWVVDLPTASRQDSPNGTTGRPGERTAPDTRAGGDEASVGDEDPRTAWGTGELTAGLAAALLAAAGLTEVLRRRRRRATATRSEGLRQPTAAPDAIQAVDRLRRAAPDGEPLEQLAVLLRTLPVDASPTMVWWDDHGAVTVAFDDAPPVEAAAPWTGALVGGRAVWTSTLGTAGPERSWGLPLLVTVGRNEGRTIALNLAAAQHLALDGTSELTRQRLLAIGMEVATSRLSGPLEVVTTTCGPLDQLERVRTVTDLREVVDESVEEHGAGLLPADRTPRLLLAGRHDVAPHLPDAVAGLVGTVAADSRPGWQLRLASTGEAVLVMPDEARLPVALPDVPTDLVLDELARLDQVAPLDSVEQLVEPTVEDGAGGEVAVPEPCYAEVRVLGPVEVVVGGERVSLAPRTLDVLTYLAIHRDGVEAERLDEAVWAGAASPDSQRVRAQLGKLRGALGDGPDGEPILPPRTQQDRRIVLSSAIGTDLDRAMRLVQDGRRAGGDGRRRAARAALELVRGRPFDLMDLPEWAAEAEHVAIARLQDEAVWLARDARLDGRHDDALWAVRRGLDLFDLAEQLWAEWLRIAAAADDRDEVRRVMGRARTVLSADADEVTGTALGPSSELEGLYGELLTA